MSPYVVTTKRREHERPVEFVSREVVSRRAFATLDEAQHLVDRECTRQWFGKDAFLPESGGTVGPLPDGTVIEVERAEWADLAESVDWLGLGYVTEEQWPEVLAAFNAQEATR